MKIHHAAIICSDLEQAKWFYGEVLALPLLRETHRERQSDVKLDYALEGAELEIFIKPDCPARPSYPEAYGLRHLAFYTDNMDREVARLTGLGVSCEPVRMDDVTGGRMTFFFDPDGLPLELHE